MQLEINIYRFNAETDAFPYMQTFNFTKPERDIMVLELLNLLKEQDPTISYRRSCREGVCGSDGMNINGKNGLACITPLSQVLKGNKLDLRPLPGLPVIRDLVVDMEENFMLSMKRLNHSCKMIRPHLRLSDYKVQKIEIN